MKQIIPFYKEIVFKTSIATITSMSLEHQEKVSDGEITGEFIIFGDYKVHNDTTEKEPFKYKLPFTALIPDNLDINTIVIDVENFNYEQIDDDVIRIDIDFSIEGENLETNETDEIDKEIDEILGRDLEEKDNEEREDTSEEIDTEAVTEVEVLPLDELKEKDLEIKKEEIPEVNNEELERDNTMMNETNNEVNINVLNDMSKIVNEDEIKKEEPEIDAIPTTITKSTTVEEKTEESEYVTYHVHLVKENETLEQIVSLYNVSVDYLKEYNEITEIKVGDKLIIPEYGEE